MVERVLYEGDEVLLFCETAGGFVFSSPPLKSKLNSLQFHITDQVHNPGLPNIHYACFKIEPWVSSVKRSFSSSRQKQPKELVYGKQVWLQHVASGWYLSFNCSGNKNHFSLLNKAYLIERRDVADSFRIVPFDMDKSIGQEIMVEDLVCLEIVPIASKMFRVLCIGVNDVKTAPNGSEFVLSSNSIFRNLLIGHQALKGGDVVMFQRKNREDCFLTVRSSSQNTVLTNNGFNDHEELSLIQDAVDFNFNTGTENSDSCFRIESWIDPSTNHSLSSGVTDQFKTLVYGSKVWLQHYASGEYLTFNSCTGVSSLANLVVRREDADSFCLLPSHPSKRNGEIIHMEDTVYLEIAPSAQNTTVSEKIHKVLCSPSLGGGYDLQMASDSSNFRLYSHSTLKKMNSSQALRGGDVVTFISKYHDAYLTFSEDTDQIVCTVIDYAQKSVFTGGEEFWQIENADVQYNGNWVKQWYVYIKHFQTQRYLHFEKDKLTLKALTANGKREHDEKAIFQIELLDKSDSGILKRKYIQIRHKESEKILSLKSKSMLCSKGTFREHKFFETHFEESDKKDWKFWIEEVDRATVKKFSSLSGVFSILRDYVECVKQLEENESEMGSPSPSAPVPFDAVESLEDWTSKHSSVPPERWPDMMRVLKGLELIVLGFLPLQSAPKGLKEKLCLVLKNYITCASEESQRYLIFQDQLLKAIFSMIVEDIGAESVLSVLVQCRSFGPDQKAKVLNDELFNWQYIRETILFEHKNFSFLQCLSGLCLSGGRPDRNVQREILNEIIIPCCDQEIFFQIGLKGGNVEKKNPKMLEDCTELDTFLMFQIELYAAVCKGVNIDSINTMVEDKKILTYQEAIKCTEQCSVRVQPMFFRYLVSTLVDKTAEESGTDLSNIWYIYAWKSFIDEDKDFDPIYLSAIADTHEIVSDKTEIVELQGKIQSSLDKEIWERDLKDAEEELITQRLSVLETLVAYGFYWRKDAKHGSMDVPSPAIVIEKLIGILENRDDGEPANRRTREKAFKYKAKAIDILRLFLHQTYHLGTARLIFDYQYFKIPERDILGNYIIPKSGLGKLLPLKEDLESDVEVATLSQTLQTPVQFCSSILHNWLPGAHSHFPNDVIEALNRLRWLLYQDECCDDSVHWHFPGHSHSFDYDYKLLNIYDVESKPLQDLLIQFLSCNDELLCLSAAKLFFDLFKGEVYMFNRSCKALIVLESNKDSWETYTTMVKFATFQEKENDVHLRTLLKLLQGKEEEVETSFDIFMKGVIITALVPLKKNSLMYPLDETYTSKVGQNIVLTTGVVNILLNYIIKFSITMEDSQVTLITRVCEALIRLTRENDDAKELVFSRFDDLLQAKQGVSTIACLLTEVLTNNVEACHKLSFSKIRQLFRMVITESSGNRDYLEYVSTLEAWMKVSKSTPLLLKNHQRFVATLFKKLYGEEQFKTEWDPDKLVTKPIDIASDRCVVLMHMMAICAEGIHKYCEDVCRGLFKFETLIDLMVNQELCLEHRLPFVMMMNEAYLYTEQESLVSVIEFAQNKSVWQHVDLMTQLIEEVGKKLDSLKLDSLIEKKKRLCQRIKIRIIFSQHMTHVHWQKHKVWVGNQTDHFREESISLRSRTYDPSILYQYLIEGIVPLLSVFAEKYASLRQLYWNGLPNMPLSTEHQEKLKLFGQKVEDLVKKNEDIFVSTKAQQTFWECKLRPILLTGDEAQMSSLNFALSEYETNEKPEQDEEDNLNETFKTFLENFKKLVHYEDPRTDPLSVYPKGPGFRKLLWCLFPSSETDSHSKKAISSLGRLLEIIYKKAQQALDTKEKLELDELLILVLQVLSGVLQRQINNGCRDAELVPWQDSFLNAKVHAKCLLHLSHPKDEVALQVLALLTRIGLDANERAQNEIYKVISITDSSFCETVHILLEKLLNSLSEPVSRTSSKFREYVLEDIRSASVVLDCISSFCDNQHRSMQNYLRNNKSPYRRHNIVQLVAVLLNILTVEICRETKESYLLLMKKTIKALIELITGNFENQQTVFHCQSIHSICNLLNRLAIDDSVYIFCNNKSDSKIAINPQEVRDSISKECLSESVSKAAIELLKVLIEETHKESESVKTFFIDTIDLDAIYGSMFKWRSVDAYHILKYVADAHELQAVEDLKLCLPKGHVLEKTEEQRILKDFKARSNSIEVFYKPSESEKVILTRTYFEYDPLDKLQKDKKDRVINAIVEGSTESKLMEFNKWTTGIRQIAKYENDFKQFRVFDPEKIKSHLWFYKIVYGSSYPRHIILILLTLLLNALVLTSFKVPDDSSDSSLSNSTNSFVFFPDTTYWYLPLLYVLGVPHLVLSCWMVYEFVVKELPNFVANSFLFHTCLGLWYSVRGWIFRFCRQHKMRVKRKKKFPVVHTNSSYFKVNLLGLRSLYIFLFLFSSVAGILFKGYFYTICLFYMFMNVDVVEFVAVALHRSVKQLIFVGLIIACIMLLFAVVSFIFLHDFFGVAKPLFCNSLGECFITVCREGLLGTLGRAIPFTNDVQLVATFRDYSLRSVFFDIPYYIIVTTMSLKIVTAILVNRFNTLQKERDTVNRNLMKACFICGLKNEKFAKLFSSHIKEHHNMWNYVYFMIYLDRKDMKDMTAIEKQIYNGNRLHTGDPSEEHGQIHHYPIGKAKDLP